MISQVQPDRVTIVYKENFVENIIIEMYDSRKRQSINVLWKSSLPVTCVTRTIFVHGAPGTPTNAVNILVTLRRMLSKVYTFKMKRGMLNELSFFLINPICCFSSMLVLYRWRKLSRNFYLLQTSHQCKHASHRILFERWR